MKIRNEQIAALQESEARRKTRAPAEGFDSLLTGQLGKTEESVSGQAPELTGRPDSIIAALGGVEGAAPTAETGGVSQALAEVTGQVEGLLSGLDDYSRKLASGDPSSLRGAYASLEGMAGQLAAFKAAHPDLADTRPELAAMVTELDVLTTTEMFKFNRGDYL